jgi:TIR domain
MAKSLYREQSSDSRDGGVPVCLCPSDGQAPRSSQPAQMSKPDAVSQLTDECAKKGPPVVNQVVNKVFLSHKAVCSAQAVELARALDEVTPGAGIFRSEGIREGHNWRDEIQRQLANAKCFILLYTNPELDWSWCFYEAGEFISKGRKPRPVYCLHPTAVDPPSPLSYLQTIPAERSQIETWLKRDLCPC